MINVDYGGYRSSRLLAMSLYKGSYGIDGLDGYFFDDIDPTDLYSIRSIVVDKLKEYTKQRYKLHLFVEGSVAPLIPIINFCMLSVIGLTIYVYDVKSGKYFPQDIISDYDTNIWV